MGSHVHAPKDASYGALVPASDKQKWLIKSLLSEREVPAETAMNIQQSIAEGSMTKGAATEEITFLFSCAKQPKAAPKVFTAPGEGYYLDPATEKVYKVVKSKAGHAYAKVMTPPAPGKKKGSWEYEAGAMKHSGGWTLLDLPSAEALSKKWGMCCVCGATLTDPKSVAAGIGPICQKKFA